MEQLAGRCAVRSTSALMLRVLENVTSKVVHRGYGSQKPPLYLSAGMAIFHMSVSFTLSSLHQAAVWHG